MDAQKTQIAKAILRRKDKAGGITHPDVRQYKKVQESSNQNSIALAQKETYRSLKQNREPRNKPTIK